MTLVVPFDGTELSKTALIRAAQFDTVFKQGIAVVSVIPRDTSYAQERGWIGPTERFDDETVVETLRNTVDTIEPDAEFCPIFVSQTVPIQSISNRIRKFARDNDASIVFVGSENAGRVVSSLTVGSSVTSDHSYDTMIISQPEPSNIEQLESAVGTESVIS